ncbi:SDR family oxidoreductase [Streptomyces sp. NBC_01242]|uniref:SDR family oxidoreductase n=1 Tax=unclassified Streptomyces TaxID=2593676 RepID=UPI00224DFB7C|nr:MULTISPECIES: SDR family oxidoreductase [unclassified Streptomyces]MCX4793967.1 SDR family oxidoreductase [Streptomyces sp. NBC_01242]WSJ35381.1 SDR family oxidoreductase [Streptomyces sp. NBC_01321]WSU20886.1 SDR family oxidoreductase [Streptomyces sp. NBC_01108]
MPKHGADAVRAHVTTDTDVVVVGAGPVGLMLAGELRLGGADVIVLDQLDAPTTESRASTLHARTMEILDQRGLLDEIGTPPDEPMGHFGGHPLDLRLPGPYPGQWKVPQTRTEVVLGAWAVRLGAEVRRGHRVTGLEQHPDRAVVEAAGPGGVPVRITAPYVVGCDGEGSTVRRLAGIEFPGTDARRELIRADIDGIDIRGRRFERLPHGLAIAARRGDGVTRVMVHEFGRTPRAAEASFADIVDAWRNVTGEDLSAGTPLWVNAFGDVSRQAECYRHGGVFLAGDAAHAQMPIGGQALNLGLQDAVNLGWKLAAAARGRAPARLLDSYHEERHEVGRQVLSNIRAQARLLLGGPEVTGLRQVIGELLPYDGVRARLAGMISGLDIRYGGALTDAGRPGSGPHRLAGSRLPPVSLRLRAAPGGSVTYGVEADGSSVSTAVLLRGARGMLLVTADEEERRDLLTVAARPWSRSVDVMTAFRPAGGAADGLAGGALDGVDAVLVRPDGYVAWAGTSAAGLEAALATWFARDTRLAQSVRATPATPKTTAPGSRGGPTDRHSSPTGSYIGSHIVRRENMGKLTGKTALVTGASRGMGRATAERLAREGALVAVHYATGADAAAEVVERIEKDGGRAFAVQAELGAPGGVHELFLGLEQGLKERTGSTELNILVNNAGVMGGVAAEDTTPEQFDRIFAVNAKAPFFIVQRALTNIPDGGRIVNISSGLTRFANPDEIAYAMSKGAVEMLALHFAKLLGPRNITINSVAPGITRNSNPVFDIPEAVTAMAGLSTFNRVGEPEDVADVIAFLVSDDARWVTGSFVDASGGTLLG